MLPPFVRGGEKGVNEKRCTRTTDLGPKERTDAGEARGTVISDSMGKMSKGGALSTGKKLKKGEEKREARAAAGSGRS